MLPTYRPRSHDLTATGQVTDKALLHDRVTASGSSQPGNKGATKLSLAQWLRLPLSFLALFTGAKSFCDNPVLGSRRLNRAGLHIFRLKAAHALARWRRAQLAHLLPSDLRERFDRDGYIEVRDFLPSNEFQSLKAELLGAELECRIHQQGDTITRRVAVGPSLRRRFPSLDRMLRYRVWERAMAYVASTKSQPLYYLQTILGGAASGSRDPQVELHSDTFQPSLKAWLFLTDVPEDGRPLTYIPGSHRLSPERIEWERRKSVEVLSNGDRLSQRGSLRVRPAELEAMGLPAPRRFCVPANTLVAIDTCGFHARADSDRPTLRVEIWAYCRRTPFLPWAGAGPLSWPFLADRRAEWMANVTDWLDRAGLKKQHWRAGGARRPADW